MCSVHLEIDVSAQRLSLQWSPVNSSLTPCFPTLSLSTTDTLTQHCIQSISPPDIPSIPSNHAAMELALFIIFHRDDKTPGLQLVLSISYLMKIDRMVLRDHTEAAGTTLCDRAVCGSLTLLLFLSLFSHCSSHCFSHCTTHVQCTTSISTQVNAQTQTPTLNFPHRIYSHTSVKK